jgi:Ca2+-binding EF-hand superfamily protein
VAYQHANQVWEQSLVTCVGDALSDAQILSHVSKSIDDKAWALKQAFASFDTAHDRTVSADEFREGLLQLTGMEVSQARVDQLVAAFDVEGTGRLKYFEFVRMMQRANAREAGLQACTPQMSAVASMAESDRIVTRSPPRKGAAAGQYRKPVEMPDERVGTVLDDQERADAMEAMGELSLEEAKSVAGLEQDGEVDAAVRGLAAHVFLGSHKLRKVFTDMDTHGTKSLTAEEFHSGLHKCGIELSEADAARLVQRFDRNESGTLAYFEFVKMLQTVHL